MRLNHPREVQIEHVQAYVCIRLDLGITSRSLQNEVSALRRILEFSGRSAFANSAEMLCKALGVPEGPRGGTNKAITDDEYHDLVSRAEEVDPETACVIRLERTIGLRGKEAVMSPKSLLQWKGALEAGKAVQVVHGTKGGRERNVYVPDVQAALDAVNAGIAFCRASGSCYIYSGRTLEQALARYGHVMGFRLKVKGHSLRYAFAEQRFNLYLAEGYSEEDALILLSRVLGHGDGRGKWVRLVYLRNLLPPLKRGRRRGSKNRVSV